MQYLFLYPDSRKGGCELDLKCMFFFFFCLNIKTITSDN